mgnify:CR=1 FL=1
MKEILELRKGFHEVDMHKMSAEQLLSFLTPFIEAAGFGWKVWTSDKGHQIVSIAVGLKKQKKVHERK